MVRNIQSQYARQHGPRPPHAAPERCDLRGDLAWLQLVRGDGTAGEDGRLFCVGGRVGERGGVGVVHAGGEVGCCVGLHRVGEGDDCDLGRRKLACKFKCGGISMLPVSREKLLTMSSHFGSRPSKGGR